MQTPTPPQTPTALTPAPDVPVSITSVGADGKALTLSVPRTESQMRELLHQREELSDQLESVTDRRSELAQEIARTMEPSARSGLEQRLGVLDQRILQLEADLAATGRQLVAAPAELRAETSDPGSNDEGDHFAEGLMAGGFGGVALTTILLFLTRRRWRRPLSSRSTHLGTDSAVKLERLEQGMDAIAVEIERISEGQRFVTKLLSESQSKVGSSPRIPQPVPAQD